MRKFGLIGNPLDHSRSKEYFTQKFKELQLDDCIYENYQLPDLEDFHELILRYPDISGLNITLPYKKEIVKYLDDLDPSAEITGAVNCVKISRLEQTVTLKGYNTDWQAFLESLKPLLGSNDKSALVLGTGGAAKAVVHALNHLNIGCKFVSRIAGPGVITYEDLVPGIINDFQIIVNATPVGMYPDIDNCPPLPYSYLTGHHLLYDLVYNPEETLFLLKGKENGARTKNGYEMLRLQAELSWGIWNDLSLKP